MKKDLNQLLRKIQVVQKEVKKEVQKIIKSAPDLKLLSKFASAQKAKFEKAFDAEVKKVKKRLQKESGQFKALKKKLPKSVQDLKHVLRGSKKKSAGAQAKRSRPKGKTQKVSSPLKTVSKAQ